MTCPYRSAHNTHESSVPFILEDLVAEPKGAVYSYCKCPGRLCLHATRASSWERATPYGVALFFLSGVARDPR